MCRVTDDPYLPKMVQGLALKGLYPRTPSVPSKTRMVGHPACMLSTPSLLAEGCFRAGMAAGQTEAERESELAGSTLPPPLTLALDSCEV